MIGLSNISFVVEAGDVNASNCVSNSNKPSADTYQFTAQGTAVGTDMAGYFQVHVNWTATNNANVLARHILEINVWECHPPYPYIGVGWNQVGVTVNQGFQNITDVYALNSCSWDTAFYGTIHLPGQNVVYSGANPDDPTDEYGPPPGTMDHNVWIKIEIYYWNSGTSSWDLSSSSTNATNIISVS